MKEDLAIAKNSLVTIFEENQRLKKELGVETNDAQFDGVRITNITEAESENKTVSAEVHELQQRLDEERKLRQEADKELELQVKIDYLLVSYIFKI